MTTFCIAIFLFCYVNATMFWHGHSVQGNWLFHSHLADWAHRTAHSDGDHTAAQFQLLVELSLFACTGSAVPSFGQDVFRQEEPVTPSRPDSFASECSVCAVSLRGPPELV